MSETWQFIGKRKKRRYHSTFCPKNDDSSPESKIIFQTAREAEEAGYRPCRCPAVVGENDLLLYHRISCPGADPARLGPFTIFRSSEAAEKKGYEPCAWCFGKETFDRHERYIESPADELIRMLQRDARAVDLALSRNGLLPQNQLDQVQVATRLSPENTARNVNAIAQLTPPPTQLGRTQVPTTPTPTRRSVSETDARAVDSLLARRGLLPQPVQARTATRSSTTEEKSSERTFSEDLQADWESLTLDGDVKAGLRLLAELAGLANLGILGVALLSLASGALAPIGLTIGGGIAANVANLAFEHYDKLKTTERKKVDKALKWLKKVVLPMVPLA